MRKFFALVVFILFVPAINAQKKDDVFYVFKLDWSSAKSLDDAAYFMEVVAEDDTTYICRYYKKFGPMVKQETYIDAALSIPNGFFAWYDDKGKIDSCGSVYLQKKDGTWRYYDDSIKQYATRQYNKGTFIKRENFLTKTVTYADGRVESTEPALAANGDTAKTFCNTGAGKI